VTPGRVFEVDAMFRDTIAPEITGEEQVVHEYSLNARVDASSFEVLALNAQPRVLPYAECPAALASAERVVGKRLTDLRNVVRAEFLGVTTCTHLNDFLRSLEDVCGLMRQANDDRV
jgi:hypothetical protein